MTKIVKTVSICSILEPDTPVFHINDSSTTENQIFVTVSTKDGGFDLFQIGSEEGLNYTTQGPKFTITKLKPGQRYHFWATVTYKNHESDRTDTLTVCTGIFFYCCWSTFFLSDKTTYHLLLKIIKMGFIQIH